VTDEERLEKLQEVQIELEAAWDDFCQSGVYNDRPLLQMSGWLELNDAIAKILGC